MTDTPTTDLTPEAVERFDLEQPTEHMGSASMKPEPSYGDWVRYTDYAALSAALEAEKARAENYGALANVNQHGWGLEKARAEDAEAKLEAKGDALTRATFRADVAEARAEAAEAKLKRAGSHLEAMIDAFEEHVALPDKNCSCHISPPCGDCENYSFARETLSDARAFLASLKGDKP